ncbi:uncharacterized protein J4E79_009386 [Alternaria viburni]|uniref:uncharacterized protein n=1 Tax=Alternaria viburni TaxID=566460 RepID=UPI0020C58703|nr:uncharacterized protein J4E79_009386 [Alternaria viburni]KAI4651187.1 hypothetical protein J4E79_009386 [Alternaria viburni]
MATDYDFSDEFTTAQYLSPGRGPILIEHNPPPPPNQPLLQRILHQATPQLSTDTMTIFVVLVLTSPENTSFNINQVEYKMPSYYQHILQQLPSLIATILLALIFRKIFYKYLNTARKRKHALRVVNINIGIIFLLYVVGRNAVMVAEMQDQLKMEGILGRCM